MNIVVICWLHTLSYAAWKTITSLFGHVRYWVLLGLRTATKPIVFEIAIFLHKE